MSTSTLNPSLVTAAALVVATLGVFGALSSYQVSKVYSAQSPDAYGGEGAQERFAPLLVRLPASAEIGYFTDLNPTGAAYSAAFLAAQYAVAPRVLLFLDGRARPEWAVGNFSKPGDFAAAGEARGYSLVADLGNGVVLYRSK